MDSGCSAACAGGQLARLNRTERLVVLYDSPSIDLQPLWSADQRNASALCAFCSSPTHTCGQLWSSATHVRQAYGWERPVASRSVSARIDSHCVRPHARARTHLVCIVSTRMDMTMCDRDDCLFRLVDAREPVQPRR